MFGYSSENLLVSAPGGVTLGYDPLLRLTRTAGASVTRFGYDGQDLIAEYDALGNLARRYVHGTGSDEPVVWYEGSGTNDRAWLHADERGSVVAVSGNTGTAQLTNSYDEFGIPGSGNSGRFQYTGQTWLPEVGLYYYKARMYSPTLGRFMQTDPIGYGDGVNWYNYVSGDPVNKTDPSGLAIRNAKPLCTQPNTSLSEDRTKCNWTTAAPKDKAGQYAGMPTYSCAGVGRPVGFRKCDDGLSEARNDKPSPDKAYDPNTNYCGGGNGIRLPNAGINDACYRHDVCYDGSGTSRLTCDNRFARDIMIQCTERTFIPALCATYSLVYYTSVRNVGWKYYKGKK